MKSPINRRDTSLFHLLGLVLFIVVTIVGIALLVRTIDDVIMSFRPDPLAVEKSISLPDDPIELLEAGEESHVMGALPSREAWQSKFVAARKRVIASHPLCEACGCRAECNPLNAHHVISVLRIVEEKLDEALQWSDENLIMLCRDHHFTIGHNGNWKTSNAHVRRDAAKMFEETWPGWTYRQLVEDYEKNKPTVEEVKSKRMRPRPSKTTQSP